jgi:hypothetical protein
VNRNPYGGSTPAVRVFVTVCFGLWAALSYIALFVLATVFWVAYLESKVHPAAFAEYVTALVGAIASAGACLWLWKRVQEYPWLYVAAAWIFAVVIVAALVVGTIVAVI